MAGIASKNTKYLNWVELHGVTRSTCIHPLYSRSIYEV